MKGKKLLVVGASGQIGAALALALAKENEVTGLSRFSVKGIRKELDEAGVRTVAKDLQADPLEGIGDEFDVVFNQAVDWPGPPERGADAALELNGYLQGRLMERTPSAIHIYGSSMAVPDNEPPVIDELTPTRRRSSVYCSTKLVGESLTVHLSNFQGIQAAILRYMWPCGSHQLRGPDALLDLVRKVTGGETIRLERRRGCLSADGTETREVLGGMATPLHVDDVAALTINAVEVAAQPPEVVHVFGPALSISEIIEEIETVFGARANTETVEPESPALVPYYDRDKMLRMLGREKITLTEILQRLKARMEAT